VLRGVRTRQAKRIEPDSVARLTVAQRPLLSARQRCRAVDADDLRRRHLGRPVAVAEEVDSAGVGEGRAALGAVQRRFPDGRVRGGNSHGPGGSREKKTDSALCYTTIVSSFESGRHRGFLHEAAGIAWVDVQCRRASVLAIRLLPFARIRRLCDDAHRARGNAQKCG